MSTTVRTPVPNFRCSSREECDTSITVGDRVRTYDFEHTDDCYVEGVVEKIVPVEGCDRYHVTPTKRVWGGLDYPEAQFSKAGYFPPINGTRVAGTLEFTNGVRKL